MTEPNDNPVVVEQTGSILTLKLNRPARLNAVSTPMYQTLVEVLDGAAGSGARAVVLTGEGRAFCVGADLKAHAEGRSDQERQAYIELGQQACLAIQQCPVPVVAAVRGYALGAGAEMALSADFVIMADDAQMGFPEVGLGTFFGGGVTARMVELVGMSRAKEVLLLGDRFNGRQAEEWGLVYRSVPERDLDSTAAALAGRLATLAPVSVAFAKRIMSETRGLGTDEVMRREAKALAACMETSDWAEGVRAFAEKRQPRFEGR